MHGCLHDLLALCRPRHDDGLPRRFCPALAACVNIGVAVGYGDVGETRPPVCADETTVRLVTFELIDDLEERQRLPLAAPRRHGEFAGILALAVAQFGTSLRGIPSFSVIRNSVPTSLVLEAQAISTVKHDLIGNLGKRHDVLHLTNGLDLARHANQGDALEARIAQKLKIGRQAVARLPAADDFFFAVGD